MAKSSTNGQFSMAMLNNQRIYHICGKFIEQSRACCHAFQYNKKNLQKRDQTNSRNVGNQKQDPEKLTAIWVVRCDCIFLFYSKLQILLVG